jgi:hypothetical protein
LDKLKDWMALALFKIENPIAAGGVGDGTPLLFMVPLTALNLVVRCSALDVSTRKDLCQIAYDSFLGVLNRFPQGRPKKVLIAENVTNRTKSTLWTRNQCMRGICNLCVALYAALKGWEKEKYPLALNRIGTHSVECFFGMVRSVMRGDARWTILRSSIVHAELLKKVTADLGVTLEMNRFANAGGCTISEENPGTVHVDFMLIRDDIEKSTLASREEVDTVDADGNQLFACHRDAILAVFKTLKEQLDAIGYKDRFDVASELSGYGQYRILMTHGDIDQDGDEPDENGDQPDENGDQPDENGDQPDENGDDPGRNGYYPGLDAYHPGQDAYHPGQDN